MKQLFALCVFIALSACATEEVPPETLTHGDPESGVSRDLDYGRTVGGYGY